MWSDEHFEECPRWGDDGRVCECDDIAESMAADRQYDMMVDRMLEVEETS